MHLAITSTVKGAPHSVARCVRSTQDQAHRDFTHTLVCIDEQSRGFARRAAGDDERYRIWLPDESNGAISSNLQRMWKGLPDETPIVWLDGDDWLAVPHALGIVNAAHERGALVTYGSFILPDGSMGFARPAGPRPRREPWGASHLKTFRAGLVNRMRAEDWLDEDGSPARHCPDLRVMFACLEMAPKRSLFIQNMLVVYNVETSFWANASKEERSKEQQEEKRIREFEAYEALSLA